jgi:hypothetical protein
MHVAGTVELNNSLHYYSIFTALHREQNAFPLHMIKQYKN